MAPKKNETVIIPVIPQAVPVVPPTALGNSRYENIYEGQLTNTFTTVNSKKTKHREIIDKNGNQGWLFDLNEIGGGDVVLSEPDKNTLSMTSSQLLDIIALRLTEVLPYGGSFFKDAEGPGQKVYRPVVLKPIPTKPAVPPPIFNVFGYL